jgi:hypothetical protein
MFDNFLQFFLLIRREIIFEICNRLDIFLYCHKVGYKAKMDEIIISYSMNKINADTSNLSVSVYE